MCIRDRGYTAQGDHVIMNKYVYDADVAVLIGHTQGNPYGGYSGGYKPVSYTHLDVYKRQGADRADRPRSPRG